MCKEIPKGQKRKISDMVFVEKKQKQKHMPEIFFFSPFYLFVVPENFLSWFL